MATREELSARKAEQWGRIVREWEKSGLPHGEFCRRRGVTVHSLRAWIYKLKKRGCENLLRGSVLPASRKRFGAPGTARQADGAMDKPSRGARKRTDGNASHEVSPASVFLPVRVAAEAKADTGVEVVLAAGRRIAVGHGFDPETLLRLVATLEGSRC